MSDSKIISSAKAFATAISATVVSQALAVCDAVTAEYDDMTRDSAKALAKKIVADYPKASRGARASEWTGFIMAAGNEPLAKAIKEAKERTNGRFSRIQLFALCRILNGNKARDYKHAVTLMLKKKVGGVRVGTLGMGLGIIKKLPSTGKGSKQLIQFRKELAALCSKYGYSY